MSSSTSSHVSPSEHTLRQLKLIVPGSIITYYIGTIPELWRLVHDDQSWGHTAASGGLLLGCLTILLFLWVLLTPWLRGVEPDFRSWRQSGVLSSVIPTLTSTIVLGWLLLVVTFGQYSSIGYLRGVVGVSAVYMLIFGLLGLIPAPKVRRK